MPSRSPSPTNRPLSDILARLRPDGREEVEYRAAQGDLPFLPEDVQIGEGQLFFQGVGWVPAPGVDPAKLKTADIEVLFMIRRGSEWMVEIRLKDASPLPDRYDVLRKNSAFRTKSAVEKYLRRASPTVARELISRLMRGQIAFLPNQLRVAGDGVYLILKAGAVKIPGLDPRDFALGQVALVFIVPNPGDDMMEIIWKTQRG
jgi:hypothetical protein